MKTNFKILTFALFALATIACSSPKKMVKEAENVTVSCSPTTLEAVAGKITTEITVNYPENYFHPQAILEVTPVIVYEGGESKLTPFVYQGEKVKDNGELVNKDGDIVTKKLTFDYVKGMEKSYLELRGVVKSKNKSYVLPSKKVADGVNTTYMLACTKGKVDFKADNYQEIIKQTAEGQINYSINSSYVNSNVYKSESIKNFQAAIDEIKANERKTIVSTDIVAYASPDGKEDMNTKLSDKRSETANKVFEKATKENPLNAPVDVKSIGEDWDGFQDLVANSDLEDKELIIRVLSMYSNPEVREKEIKNMSAVYKSLAKDILPALRRARFIANVEYTNFTSEELLKLIDSNADALDEEALLRTASLVKDDATKIAIYNKAATKYNSVRAQYNIAVVNLKANKIAEAKDALAKVSVKDADYNNAMGVVALQEGNFVEAAKCFVAAGTATAKENLAVIDIYNGNYDEAAAKLAGTKSYNEVVALVLTGNAKKAEGMLNCDCPYVAYLNAVIAARLGKAEDVKANLTKASEEKSLAAKAAKDIEFVQF